MAEQILGFLDHAGEAISLVGVAVIVVGFLVATVRGVADFRRHSVSVSVNAHRRWLLLVGVSSSSSA